MKGTDRGDPPWKLTELEESSLTELRQYLSPIAIRFFTKTAAGKTNIDADIELQHLLELTRFHSFDGQLRGADEHRVIKECDLILGPELVEGLISLYRAKTRGDPRFALLRPRPSIPAGSVLAIGVRDGRLQVVSISAVSAEQLGRLYGVPSAPPAGPIWMEDLDELFPHRKKLQVKVHGSSSGPIGARRSTRAKLIGDLAEEFVFTELSKRLRPEEASTLKWCSRNGETPGWDIEYAAVTGDLVRIEVKGTVAVRFSSFELTSGELEACRTHGAGFKVFLVTGVTTSPKIAQIDDLADLLSRGKATATPVIYEVRR